MSYVSATAALEAAVLFEATRSRQFTYQREIVTADLIAEAMALFHAHHAENASMPDVPLSVDGAAYVQAENLGLVRFYTVRDNAGDLGGYSLMFVRPHPHRAQTVQATQDILYLKPTLRHGLAGVRLIAFADDELRKEGVTAVHRSTTVEKNIGPLLERLGYRHTEELYTRKF